MLEGRGNLASLRLLFCCVGPEARFGRRHAVDVPRFGKHSSPVCLPIGPGVVGHRSATPLPPRQGHVSGRERMFCARRDHRGFGDGDTRVGGKIPAFLLLPGVDGEGEDRIHADVELGHVVVHVRLADLGIRCEDVHHQCAEVNAVEPLDGIIEHGVVDVVDGRGKLVAHDGEDEAICCPCLLCGGVGGTEFFALGSGGNDRNDGIGQDVWHQEW